MIVLFTSVLSVGSVSILLNTVKAQEGQSFSATLSGKDEVPPTESNSTGTAKFQVNENNSQVSYWVNITGIKKVNQAHIHNGTSGENGDIVATLDLNQDRPCYNCKHPMSPVYERETNTMYYLCFFCRHKEFSE